jgi:hypothetical protein
MQAAADETGESDANSTPVTLEQLTREADFIALALARDTDYFYRRDFPVSGSAYLKVLIPYRIESPVDIVEVFERGLRDNECYFPETTVFEEGRRYLLFLRRDPDDTKRYRGLEWGCAIEVLVDEENRYAIRYPVAGINISDDLTALVRPLNFKDANALVTGEDLDPSERDALLKAGHLKVYEGKFKFTHGIRLDQFRQLMNLEK